MGACDLTHEDSRGGFHPILVLRYSCCTLPGDGSAHPNWLELSDQGATVGLNICFRRPACAPFNRGSKNLSASSKVLRAFLCFPRCSVFRIFGGSNSAAALSPYVLSLLGNTGMASTLFDLGQLLTWETVRPSSGNPKQWAVALSTPWQWERFQSRKGSLFTVAILQPVPSLEEPQRPGGLEISSHARHPFRRVLFFLGVLGKGNGYWKGDRESKKDMGCESGKPTILQVPRNK